MQYNRRKEHPIRSKSNTHAWRASALALCIAAIFFHISCNRRRSMMVACSSSSSRSHKRCTPGLTGRNAMLAIGCTHAPQPAKIRRCWVKAASSHEIGSQGRPFGAAEPHIIFPKFQKRLHGPGVHIHCEAFSTAKKKRIASGLHSRPQQQQEAGGTAGACWRRPRPT